MVPDTELHAYNLYMCVRLCACAHTRSGLASSVITGLIADRRMGKRAARHTAEVSGRTSDSGTTKQHCVSKGMTLTDA